MSYCAFAAHRWEVMVGGGGSSAGLLSNTPNRRFFLLGGGYARDLLRRHNLELEYTGEIVPLVLTDEPHEEGVYSFSESDAIRVVNQGPAGLYAFGVAPIGFRATLWPRRRVAPYASMSGGFLYSARAIPYQVEDGTQFNFNFHVGAGVRLSVGLWSDILIGYRWLHISNAYRTVINPGIDVNLITVTFSFGQSRSTPSPSTGTEPSRGF